MGAVIRIIVLAQTEGAPNFWEQAHAFDLASLRQAQMGASEVVRESAVEMVNKCLAGIDEPPL